MDLMTKLGGRKFLMALIVIAAAIYLEVSGKGLSPTMAAFLVGVIGAFSAANFATTSNYMNNRSSGSTTADLHEKIDNLTESVESGFSPDKTENLRQLLSNINSGVSQIQTLSGQVAQAMVNQNSMIQNLKLRG